MVLLTINKDPNKSLDYSDRKVVKIVVINQEGQILLFPHSLIGGGVEKDEADKDAIHREALEEAGIRVEIIEPIGEVIAYRDVLKLKYITHGYTCTYLETISTPTTKQEDEQGMTPFWEEPDKSIARIKTKIRVLKEEGPSIHPGDSYQSKVYNCETTLAFLIKVFEF
jgi:8-oxo-dGTP pyrophosphatase MutT (NUDIX family)